ncbi:MAG: DUF2802 domain-containing protein [Pseudomonadota bacterium]
MMNTLELLATPLLHSANVLLLGMAVIAMLRLRRLALQLRRTADNAGGRTKVDSTIESSQNSGLLRVERQLRELQSTVRVLAQTPKPERTGTKAPASLSYAMRMAKQGASKNDLVKNCGLSTAEASLVRKIHCRN